MPRQQRGDRLHRLARRVAAGEAEAERPEHAAVGLQHHHVLAELGAMLIAVGEPAAAAVLLVGPQHDAHRPPRTQVQLLHDPQRLPRHHAAAAIVGRAGADVPRVEVAADDDDFVRLLASADLADDVGRLGVGLEVRLHLQPHDDPAAAIRHALQPIGVLGRNRRGRNLLRVARRTAARRCAACAGRRCRRRGSACATAPWRAARDGPPDRKRTVSP